MPRLPQSLLKVIDHLDRRALIELSRYVAARLGHFGGAKGGKTTAMRRTPAERREAARKAIMARWAKVKAAQKK